MADLAHGDAEGPAHDQHRHGRGEFAAGEPVDDHLGEEDGGDHEAHAAQQAAQRQQAEIVGRGRHAAAQRQRPEPAATSARSET